MAYNSSQSLMFGFLFGIAPGGLLAIIGLVLGGEWAWTLGLIGVWLITIGVFAGPLLGAVGPEIVAERPAISGAMLGALPGLLFSVLFLDDVDWINLLAIVGGSMLGALVGHWMNRRREHHPGGRIVFHG
jgi:hypothetical protein